MHAPTRSFPSRQRGISLLEALIAFLILSIGMLTLSKLQNVLRVSADGARERSEAVRLAQIDIEQLRTFVDTAGWTATADASAEVTPAGSTTSYTLQRTVQTRAEPTLKSVRVTLRWTDRQGAPQQLQLDTLIGGQDPALSGALKLPRPALAHP